jgi:hypothetical protein
MLKNNIACFQEIYLSFIRFDVSYGGVHLPEAELMTGY